MKIHPSASSRLAGTLGMLALSALCVLALAPVSCQSSRVVTERRFPLTGKVVAVDAEHRQVMLNHDEIPGYMEAMTMPFNVQEEWVMRVLAPGHRIQATLVVTEDRSWIEGVTVIESAPAGAAGESGEMFPEPEPGAVVPDFRFFNQDGKSIGLQDYRGKALLVTFIYTRCPLPDFCPRMSKNFSQVQAEMRRDARLGTGAHLISISFDPDYDRPPVLRKYGSSYVDPGAADPFVHWEFAGGTAEEVGKAAQFLGLTYTWEGKQIAHNLRTALIGPDCRLVRLYRGNSWTPSEVVSEMRRLLR